MTVEEQELVEAFRKIASEEIEPPLRELREDIEACNTDLRQQRERWDSAKIDQ